MDLRAVAVMALVFVGLGCDRPGSPPPAVEAPPRGTSAEVVAVATPPVEPAPEQPVVVPEAAPPADIALAPTQEVAGEGRCKTDDDCVLSSWQAGCCTQACDVSAVNRRDLAARQAKENCATDRPEVCPPPAPCPPRTHEVLAARCSRRVCVSVQRRLP